MYVEEKIKFLKENIQPLKDFLYGDYYRTAVTLKDGLYLPCVRFFNPSKKVDLAIKRFEEEKSGKSVFHENPEVAYRFIVNNFVAKGNLVNEYDIAQIEKSPYAMPSRILEQVKGETTMSWTGFVAKMKDDQLVAFGTTFLFDFFQMPNGSIAEDIVEIYNHSYISKSGELKRHKVPFAEYPEDYDESKIFRERPAFDCFIEGL